MTTIKAPLSEGAGIARLNRSFVVGGAPVPAPPLNAGLYVVATPIGNLADVTLRALAILAGADAILAEDTRVSRTLLARYGIETPLSPYHEHNAAEARPRALRRIAEGQALALISDAGTPLISDPGYKLVAEAVAAGLRRHRRAGPVRGARRALRRRLCRPTVSSSKGSCRPRARRGGSASTRSPPCPARSSSTKRRAASPRRSPTSRSSSGRGPPRSRAN